VGFQKLYPNLGNASEIPLGHHTVSTGIHWFPVLGAETCRHELAFQRGEKMTDPEWATVAVAELIKRAMRNVLTARMGALEVQMAMALVRL
jgi:hypothetical protein